MEAADDAQDAALAGDPLGLLQDVADAAVGAAGDHIDPLPSPISEGGVVRVFVRPVLPLPDGGILHIRIDPGNGPKIEQVLRQGHGLRREAEIEILLQLRPGIGAADGQPPGQDPAEQSRMGHQLGLRTLGEEGAEAPGVVVVAMGEDHSVHAPPVDAHSFRVPGEDAEIPRIQQEPLPLRLHEAGEARLPQQISVDQGVVVG